MKLYAIRRRDGWTCPESLSKTAEVSIQVAEGMEGLVRWIRSYVVREQNGDLGTICIYEAASIEAIREHARRVGMPADEIDEVIDTVVIRPDPVVQSATQAD